MKFTDGHWRMRPGVTPHYAVQVHDVEIGAGTLTVYAATRRIARRGDGLDMPVLTVQYSSPMPDVIGVRMYHHMGRRPRKPRFALNSRQDHEVRVDQDEQSATLSSGRLTVRVQKGGDLQVEFRDGERVITGSGPRAAGYMDTPDGNYILEQLDLAVGECVYGLGERFTPFVKNGQVVDLWNEDAGTNSEQTYKNVPFYLTNRGYGVFVNHPERVSLEVASEKVERVQFSVPGEALEYFIIYGPSPKEVLERYTALTGRPALPPAWSFGLWLSTSFTTDYGEETVTSFIEGMAERDLPLHVFHFDCFWMRDLHWVDFKWDERMFPDPKGMLERLKARGLHICVWINPYVAQQSEMFAEGMEGGYLLKRPNGDVWQWDLWQPGMALVDFTNPAACRWYGDKLRALLDMGVDCLKTDFGERIPTDVVYFDGSDPDRMHNYYTYLYNQTVFQLLEEKRGVGEAVVFARSATAGGQQFPVHWGGDCTATYPSMAESLRGGLSLGLSGFGFWSHDIGGFEQTATPDLYKRWCAFGLLSSHSRLHGSNSYRVPWLFDEEAVDVLRFFTKLKCRLMPYLFEAAGEAHRSGVPMMRAMMLEFPDDPACDYARPPVHARRLAAGCPGLFAGRLCRLLPACRALDQLPHGAGGGRWPLAAREARLHEPAPDGTPELGDPRRLERPAARLRLCGWRLLPHIRAGGWRRAPGARSHTAWGGRQRSPHKAGRPEHQHSGRGTCKAMERPIARHRQRHKCRGRHGPEKQPRHAPDPGAGGHESRG